jgi:hypothetical protein
MSDKKQLKTRDFSKPAVQKAVALHTLEHPAVLYPTTISILGGFAALLMGANPLLLTIAAGGAGAAVLSWAVNFGIRRDHFANQYVKKLHAQMENQRLARQQELQKALTEVSSEEGRSQFSRITEKFTTFQKLLARKLNPGELTYGRYLGMAEQVYLGVLDNLQRIADTLRMMSVIDVEYTQKRLQQLQNARSQNNNKEIDTLKERLALHSQQAEKVQKLFSQNEEAMTKMDLTIAAIADMRTEGGRASMDMETAMAELQRLAGKAKDYSTK